MKRLTPVAVVAVLCCLACLAVPSPSRAQEIYFCDELQGQSCHPWMSYYFCYWMDWQEGHCTCYGNWECYYKYPQGPQASVPEQTDLLCRITQAAPTNSPPAR
ncbi:MAG: hypothetical protein ABUT39_28275 [Acidobacteriota bacterium]